jgi:site-specific DNA recombinase
MNGAGYRTRKGGKFSDTTVKRLLTDPITKGLKRSNYTYSTGVNKKWALKPESEWVFQDIESIVSEELWTVCNALLDQRATGPKITKRTVHLFTGLIRCACGGGMTVKFQSPSYTCQKCSRKIRLDDMEAVFRGRLQDFFSSAEEVRTYLEGADEALVQKRELLTALQSEFAQVRSGMDKTYKLYLDGVISSEGFGERYGPLETRSKALADEIPRLQGEADFLAIQHLSSEEIVSEAQDVYGGWDNLAQEEKRGIVETIVRLATVHEDSVTFDLLYSPPTPQIAVEGQHINRGSWRRSLRSEPETQR